MHLHELCGSWMNHPFSGAPSSCCAKPTTSARAHPRSFSTRSNQRIVPEELGPGGAWCKEKIAG
jgi:hypothetical protein